MVFGVGVVIGAGIFVLTGIAAAEHAGPAVTLSFLLSAVACGLAALCYAEFASTVPVAGSAYTFSYASLGELPAWIIGWDLVLEFTVGASAVAISWSQYFDSVLGNLGLSVPTSVAGGRGAVMNLPAALVALLLTGVLVAGIRLSSGVNLAVTAFKLGVVLFFIGLGLFFVDPSNWTPFVPARGEAIEETTALGTPLISFLTGGAATGFGGFSGIVAGAAVVFFAYVGFDIVATTAEEAKNPQRDLPIGILGSLVACTVLYVLVTLVMTGIVPYDQLGTAAPMATAFQAIGQDWAAGLVSLGALAGLTTVIMIDILGQSRIFFAMSRDGLLPRWFGRVHPRLRTPYRITIITGVAIALIAGFVPITEIVDLFNIGTLFAFSLVSAGVVILRRTRPDLPRAFRAPLVPLVPVLAVLACGFLAMNLPLVTWLRFAAWMVIGLAVYFLYGYRKSRLARQEE